MELTINHTTKKFKVLPANLEDLITMELPEQRKGIAIALNNHIVPKLFWAETILNDKDSILIITATQGG